MNDYLIIVGADGQVGRLLCERWPDAVRITEDNFYERLPDDAPVIWVATYPPPHDAMPPRVQEMQNYLQVVNASPLRDRLIFTSSFGIEAAHGVSAINPYAAGKIAGEAFTEAWARLRPSRSGISIRLGGFGLHTEPYHPWRMTEQQVVAVYEKALAMPPGYHVIRPLHQGFTP